eukprot:10809088-Ditylum_brightwellii.AAC.1
MDSDKSINARIIPNDLLPCDQNKYNINWARNTYKYAHLFNAMRYKSVAYNDNNVVGEWLVYANELIHQMQNNGLETATNKLLEIPVEDYNWKMPTTSTQSPLNFEDLMK